MNVELEYEKLCNQIKGLRSRTYTKFVGEASEVEILRRKRAGQNQILRGATDYELGARASKTLELSRMYKKLNKIVQEMA